MIPELMETLTERERSHSALLRLLEPEPQASSRGFSLGSGELTVAFPAEAWGTEWDMFRIALLIPGPSCALEKQAGPQGPWGGQRKTETGPGGRVWLPGIHIEATVGGPHGEVILLLLCVWNPFSLVSN